MTFGPTGVRSAIRCRWSDRQREPAPPYLIEAAMAAIIRQGASNLIFASSHTAQSFDLSFCDLHYRRMRKVDGPEWRWLTTLRHDLN
jgi:hypothetical protein